jgi:hypothetical protein
MGVGALVDEVFTGRDRQILCVARKLVGVFFHKRGVFECDSLGETGNARGPT